MEPLKSTNKAGKQAEAKAREEARQRAEVARKSNAKRAWQADGGSAEDFEKAWPEMSRQSRAERASEASEAARRNHREQVRRMF